MSDTIFVYDKNGEVVNNIDIKDRIEYVDGRVCRGDKCYYKGIGIPYVNHHIQPEDMTDEYDLIGVGDVFYIGNIVSKKVFAGKTGIFQEKYQTHFTDWTGACGIKELNIFENLYDEGRFEMSAINVFERETIDEKEQQYYLKVDYPQGRVNYIRDPSPTKLRTLLDYMIHNDWNFPWDKNSISDINFESKVTDVADLFKSKELSHKLGSVYSVLYSLYQNSPDLYQDFCDKNNLPYRDDMGFIFNTLILLAYNDIDIIHLYEKTPLDTYKKVVYNYIISGTNCGFCGVGSCKRRVDDNFSYGEYIKQGYIKRYNEDFLKA